MKHFLIISLLSILFNVARAQHTIFPFNKKAIQCKIERVTKDSIFFIPDFDTLVVNSMPLKKVDYYTYNKSFVELNLDSIPIYISEPNDIPKVNDFDNLNKWQLVAQSGKKLKSSVTFSCIGFGLLAIAPFTVKMDSAYNIQKYPTTINGKATTIDVKFGYVKPNYTIPIVLAVLGFSCNIVSIINLYQTGDMLDKAGQKGNNNLSLNVSPLGFSLCKKF